MRYFLSLWLFLTVKAENSLAPNPLLPPTSVTTSQCNSDNQCTCVIDAPEPCSIDYEYQSLVQAREKLNLVYEHLDGEIITKMDATLASLVTRMTTLEASLHNQSISLTITELQGLQDQVVEIQEALALITSSRNGTFTEQLRAEVDKIQASLLLLGRRNPIAVKEDLDKEITRLKQRLASCSTATKTAKENDMVFVGDGLPANHHISPDVCPATTNITIGEPQTFKFQAGQGNAMWWKDPYPRSEVDKTKIYEVLNTATTNQKLQVWKDLADFESTSFMSKVTTMPCNFHIYGKKFLVRNGTFIWMDQYGGVNKLRKFDTLHDPTCTKQTMSTYNFPYTAAQYDYTLPIYPYNDADLNEDETGTYVVWANAQSDVMISKINPETLEKEKNWNTGKRKQSLSMSFMICGRLYTVDDYDDRYLSGKQWGFDTTTGEEFFHDLNIEFKYGGMSALSYNPREKALFGWDNLHAVYYPVYV